MKPLSILHIKAYDGIWVARQKFLKLGESVTVREFGFTRAQALRRFEQARTIAEEAQPFRLIEFLGEIKRLLKPKM